MSGPYTQSGSGKSHRKRPLAAAESCGPGDYDYLCGDEGRQLEAANARLSEHLQELAQTYQELEDPTSNAQAHLLFIDSRKRLLRFTASARSLFHLSEDDLGKVALELATKLGYPDLDRDLDQVLLTAQSREREVQAAGDCWYLVRLRPDLGARGRADGVVLSFIDISERKRAELSTQRARRYSEKILETMQEPVVVLTADLKIHSVNAAFCEVFQCASDAVLGKALLGIGGGQWDDAGLCRLLDQVLSENSSVEGFELNQDLPGLGRRTLILNIRRLDEEQLILLTVHDITTERELRLLRHRESSLLEEVDVRRRLQDMSSAVLQSASMTEMFGHVLETSLALTGADGCILQTVSEAGELETVAHRGLGKEAVRAYLQLDAEAPNQRAYREGQRVTCGDLKRDLTMSALIDDVGFRAVQASPLIGRSGKLHGILSTHYRSPRRFPLDARHVLDLLALEIADLCEWVKTERRLRQSETRLRAQSEQLLANDRQKNQFLGLLGHELRNPLTVMRNSIQTLVAQEHAFLSEPRISEALALLERQSRHMTHLVNDLLDVTRINKGKVVLKRERVSLSRSLEEVMAAHRSTMASRNLQFSIEQEEAPLYLDADAARLFQVLDNLVTNAIKFTQPGGRIEVALSREDGEAVIRVRDTGIGIPPEALESLFEPFTQVDNELACHGLGLGLSLVRSLVGLHGGEIRAFSDGEDRGSEFVIRWPLHKRQDEPARDAAPPPLALGGGQPSRRILVVDDIPDIADSFARLLEVAGHEVLVAYDAAQGRALARERRPTVAFLDMVMPEVDGLELAQQLRREFDAAQLTLVVVSGYGRSQDIERARAAGFEHHILKPIEIQQVYSLLESLNIGAEKS